MQEQDYVVHLNSQIGKLIILGHSVKFNAAKSSAIRLLGYVSGYYTRDPTAIVKNNNNFYISQ